MPSLLINTFSLVGHAFQHASSEIKMELNKLSQVIKDNTKKYTGVADDYLEEYGPYRFYFGIAVCAILLLVSHADELITAFVYC